MGAGFLTHLGKGGKASITCRDICATWRPLQTI